jgi:predicted nuclease of predicted toxin-antitoxin system
VARVSFFFDEHIPPAVAAGLVRRGIDVLTVQQAGRTGLPDAEQLDFARQSGRVMVTQDSDYLILAAEGASHAGIAYSKPQSRSLRELIDALALIGDVLDSAQMVGRVEYL